MAIYNAAMPYQFANGKHGIKQRGMFLAITFDTPQDAQTYCEERNASQQHFKDVAAKKKAHNDKYRAKVKARNL